MVPGYVPLALLLALEAAAVLVWVLTAGRRPFAALDALLACPRCVRLHERAEVFARAADAVAVGALAFLIALPFVAAGYEGGPALAIGLLGTSAVAAVLAVAAEADYLARALAARLWPQFVWDADPARIVGGGARWLGILAAVYLFQGVDTSAAPGMGALFGSIGKRLAADLGTTWTIWLAATILVLAQIVALAARWLVPLVLNSLPVTFAVRRHPHGNSA
jgi:hypothetical protein